MIRSPFFLSYNYLIIFKNGVFKLKKNLVDLPIPPFDEYGLCGDQK